MPLDTQTRALIEQMKQGGFKPASQIPVEVSRAALTQMAITMAAPKVDVFATEDRCIDGPEFASRTTLGTGEYFISVDDFAFFRDLYLSEADEEVRDPLVSPIYAENYRDLPPALVISAGYDPCLDETRCYADRLAEDGVQVTYQCFESTIHPFFLFDGVIDAGKEGQRLVAATLRDFFKTSQRISTPMTSRFFKPNT